MLGIDVPDELAASKTNAMSGNGSIGTQVGICVDLYGRYPNAVLLDYINEGQWSIAQDSMNGVQSQGGEATNRNSVGALVPLAPCCSLSLFFFLFVPLLAALL